MNQSEPTKTAREFYDQDCLGPMRRGDYETALPRLQEYLSRTDLLPYNRLAARPLLATCLVAGMEKIYPADIHEALDCFDDNLEQYWKDLDLYLEGATRQPGFKPFCEYFSEVIRYALFTDQDKLADILLEYLAMFQERSHGHVMEKDLIHVWVEEIDRERRGINTARRDHLSRAIIMGKTLLDYLEKNTGLQSVQIILRKILADTIYFFQEPGKTLQDRATEALGYLQQILAVQPGDAYAIAFSRDIRQTLAKRSQLDRFSHDSRSILGSLNQSSRSLLAGIPEDSPLASRLHTLRRQIMTLRSIALLAEGCDSVVQPAGDEWEYVDIADLIIEQLHDVELPETCLETSGTACKWEVIPGMVAVVFSNLLKNTQEAYTRSGITPPDCPSRIHVDYDSCTVHYTDGAGGLDIGLEDPFAPYISSKGIQSQTGLGLTNVRMAMKGMEGDIVLAPEQPEQGVHFVLTFS